MWKYAHFLLFDCLFVCSLACLFAGWLSTGAYCKVHVLKVHLTGISKGNSLHIPHLPLRWKGEGKGEPASMHSTAYGDYEAISLFQSNCFNLNKTTYGNYREFINIHLQQDWQTTDSVRMPTSKADYKVSID